METTQNNSNPLPIHPLISGSSKSPENQSVGSLHSNVNSSLTITKESTPSFEDDPIKRRM